MTVLYFADTRFPIERANGAQTMATCRALAARGHDVTLVVRPDTSSPARDPFAYYGETRDPRLTIRTIPSHPDTHRRRLRFLTTAARMALASRAVVVTRDLGLAALLMRVPRAARPRLVYESHGVADVVAGEMATLLGRESLAPSASKLARLARRESRVWQRAAAYVTITRTLADELGQRFGSRPRVFVVPDGVRLERFAHVPPTTAPDDAIVAGYAGHLYPWKGVDVLVQAIALAPGARAIILGGHPNDSDKARIAALAERLGVSDRVSLPGLVPPDAVAAHLAAATLLVLPNTATAISERYTSPLKLFEYLALGRPIVSADLPALREILTHEVSALLVPPGDPAALASAMTRLSTEPGLAGRLSSRARTLASDYTWDKRAERLERAIESAVA